MTTTMTTTKTMATMALITSNTMEIRYSLCKITERNQLSLCKTTVRKSQGFFLCIGTSVMSILNNFCCTSSYLFVVLCCVMLLFCYVFEDCKEKVGRDLLDVVMILLL